MVAPALLASWVPALLAAGAVGLVVPWVFRFPPVALVALGFGVGLGQLGRLELPGQGGGLLISDVITAIIVGVGFWKLRRYPLSHHAWQVLLWSLPFVGWSVWTLIIHLPILGATAGGIAGLYWVRLSFHLLLLPALLALATNASMQRLLRLTLMGVVVSLVVLGGGLLYLVPQLDVLQSHWDPHPGRLVSTWLDPNFMGGLLIIVLPWLLAEAYRAVANSRWWQLLLGLGTVGTLVALALTKSRGSLIALLAAFVLTSPLYIQWTYARPQRLKVVLGVAGLIGAALLVGIALLGERALGLLTYDPTVVLRVEALALVWGIFVDHYLVGVGFNAYQFAAQQAGLISDFTIHSRAGADVSLLTLGVTTGLPGVILFLLPWSSIVLLLWKNHRWQLPRIAALTSLAAWFTHALFVNSLLYSHLLIVVAMLLAVVLSPAGEYD